MNEFKDKVAIVTGGASGIGRALCKGLAEREVAVVIVADINAEGAEQVASAIRGGRAQAASLDVSQAEAVQGLIDQTVAQYGQLDYMFNNAGIGMAGEVRDMAPRDWQRIVDVNLWGVIYGTTSAYQVMVRQGSGHIINTASVAGLIPVPMATVYGMTKSAVVGLSTSLRAEAAGLGVRVSVVCPGAIETGIYDSLTLFNIQRHVLLSKIPFSFMDADKCAHVILRGVARNKGIITVTAIARLSWWLYRLQPSLFTLSGRKIAQKFRALREA